MTDKLLRVRDLKMHFPSSQNLLGTSTSVVKAVDGVSFVIMCAFAVLPKRGGFRNWRRTFSELNG